MKGDLTNINEIKLLVDSFYIKVKKDEIIGPIFNEVIKFDWNIHIPIMYSFWESILLDKKSYNGNPMIKHIELSKLTSMGKIQFDTWLKLWNETIDENFIGDKAEEAKMRASTIAQLMKHKIEMSQKQ